MLNKYLNKEVIIEEKYYDHSSTTGGKYATNRIQGIITNIDDNFIEIDNKMILNIKHIYRIMLK